MYVVKAGVRIGKAVKRAMPRELLSTRPHTHNARDDAIEQADLFANLFEWRKSEVVPVALAAMCSRWSRPRPLRPRVARQLADPGGQHGAGVPRGRRRADLALGLRLHP